MEKIRIDYELTPKYLKVETEPEGELALTLLLNRDDLKDVFMNGKDLETYICERRDRLNHSYQDFTLDVKINCMIRDELRESFYNG